MDQEENFLWEPRAKPRRTSRGEESRTPGLSKEGNTLSATLLQEVSECRRKAYLRIHREPERLAPSPFAREKFKDGQRFEDQIIASGRAIEILEERYPHLGPISFLNLKVVGAKKSPTDRAAEHKECLAEISREGTPTLVYQIQITEPTYSESEPARAGVADLALWTGKHWILGEIKATTRPKTYAALQLYHYCEIWKHWAPKGETTEDEIFVIHCREGWQFESSNPRQEEKCIRYATLTPFLIPQAKTPYDSAWENLTRLERETEKPPAQFCVHCAECPYRTGCYTQFAKQAKSERGLSPAFAGFDEAEVLWLKEAHGIETIYEILPVLDQLEELHANNPHVKRELKRRLVQACKLGGCSTWSPPAGNHTVVFFSRSPENDPSRPWKIAGQEPIEVIPTLPVGSLIVAFSHSEMQSAIGRIKAEGTISEKVKYICLQEEIEAETLFPYENLSLRGILRTLKGTLERETWAEHAEEELIPRLQLTRINPKAEDIGKRERILEVEALWETLLELYRRTPPL